MNPVILLNKFNVEIMGFLVLYAWGSASYAFLKDPYAMNSGSWAGLASGAFNLLAVAVTRVNRVKRDATEQMFALVGKTSDVVS